MSIYPSRIINMYTLYSKDNRNIKRELQNPNELHYIKNKTQNICTIAKGDKVKKNISTQVYFLEIFCLDYDITKKSRRNVNFVTRIIQTRGHSLVGLIYDKFSETVECNTYSRVDVFNI